MYEVFSTCREDKVCMALHVQHVYNIRHGMLKYQHPVNIEVMKKNKQKRVTMA